MDPKSHTFTQRLDCRQIKSYFQQLAESQLYIHLIDLPFRITSTWQERDCAFSAWKQNSQIIAWSVFQPPWRNLDYTITPEYNSSQLEVEILEWGKTEIQKYAERINDTTYGYVELFEDAPQARQTIANLNACGFRPASENTLRFQKALTQSLPQYQLPDGFSIRPLLESETITYCRLVNNVFSPNSPEWMTYSWRTRLFQHPGYIHKLDLVATNSDNELVGFCSGWQWKNLGQIEPIGVHPDYRAMGLASALETAIMDLMQSQGISFLYVDHGSNNGKAIALSSKNGFQHHKVILRFCLVCYPNR